MRESAAPLPVAAGLCMPSLLGWPDYSRGRNLMPIVETLPGYPGPGPLGRETLKSPAVGGCLKTCRAEVYFFASSRASGRGAGAVRLGRGLPGRLSGSVACERGAHL